MKKIVLLILLFPLLGICPKPKTINYIPDPRPTLSQQLQLAKNELRQVQSRIDVKIEILKK